MANRRPKMAKMRPKMAKRRPKTAKMRPKRAKTRPKMAKTRPKMAKLRPKMPKMRAQEGQDEAQDGPKTVKNHGAFFNFNHHGTIFFSLLRCDDQRKPAKPRFTTLWSAPLHVCMHAFWGFYRAFFKKAVSWNLRVSLAECAPPGEPFKEGEFAVPDEVGVLGVLLDPVHVHVQTLHVHVGRGTLPKPLPPDPAHSVDGSSGRNTGARRLFRVTGPSPFCRLGSGLLGFFSGSGGYFWPSCLDKADSAKIVIP